MTDINKLQTKIKIILLNEWDPIGVSDHLEAKDEYDAYIPAICNFILHKQLDKFTEYMYNLEKYRMDLEPKAVES